ncbi:TrfB-related DNA-binding protein [Paraburkholderia agricolaris]|uniref:TrfB-related DNA-binding protein n=1 Tax=Paraburkholderia agricolaris TaxID=2152888 RepID=UPI0038BACDD9
MAVRHRLTGHEFDALRPLLTSISQERIEAARSAMVDGATLQSIASRYGWTKPAVSKCVAVVWAKHEKFTAARAKAAEMISVAASTLPMNDFHEAIAESGYFSEIAPKRFLTAWKEAVSLAGPSYFRKPIGGEIEAAETKDELEPDYEVIKRALGAISSTDGLFLAALYSFYDSEEGSAMLKQCGANGLADLGRLDLPRRRVIAELIVNYCGW